MPTSDIVYDKFNWYFGVVEDRNDPLKLGRVKVRFYNVHTDDKSKVPTESLPWAVPVNPLSSGVTSGVGGPITGAVEGTWVIGFFIDQDSFQKPFVLGSIAGIPTSPSDTSKGFNDPNGLYPRNEIDGLNSINEQDTSKLARNSAAEGHVSLKQKRETRVTSIPKASAASVKAVQDDKGTLPYELETFDEPHARGHDGTAT